MTILAINQAIRECERELIDETTGEYIGDEMDFAMIEGLEMERDEKIDNLVSLYKEVLIMAQGVKEEKLKLAKRQAILEKKAESLKEYIGIVLDHCEKFESARNRVSFRAAPDTVEINCEAEELPEMYRKAKWEPIKKEILAAIKAGEQIPGVEIITNRVSTIIK